MYIEKCHFLDYIINIIIKEYFLDFFFYTKTKEYICIPSNICVYKRCLNGKEWSA